MKNLRSKKSSYLLKAIILINIIFGMYFISYYALAQGGDSEIHIVFAKNLLQGNFLEFNPGYKTGGETSPLYMLIVAMGIYFFHDNIQYFMKAVSLISIFYILYVLYQSCNTKQNLKRIIYISSIFIMPFILYQTSLGMENILFAAVVLKIVDYQYKNEKISYLIPFISIPLFMLRPEGILIPIWFGIISIFKKNKRDTLLAFFAFGLALLSYEFLNLYTGIDTLNAGKIRAYLSRTDALHLYILDKTLYLNLRVFITGLYTLPMFVLMWVHRKKLNYLDLLTLCSLVLLPTLLHIFVIFPSTHMSRYFLFEYMIIFYIFGRKIIPELKENIFIALCIVFLIFSCAEFYARKTVIFNNVKDSVRELKSEEILNYSNFLINKLEVESTPVSIGLQEVQLRARVDSRFIIWSLDGITDSELGNHLNEDSIDHIAYIKYRKIDYLLTNFENYNVDKSKQSLRSFLPFDSNYSKCVQGIILIKTAISDIYKVSNCDAIYKSHALQTNQP